jgi:hypothetical protein
MTDMSALTTSVAEQIITSSDRKCMSMECKRGSTDAGSSEK